MKKLFLSAICLSLFALAATAQQNVGIGTTTPNNSAALDIVSTSKGMLVPRMTSVQRTAIASPATGLLVFDNTENKFFFWNGAAWAEIGGAGGANFTAGTGIEITGDVINNIGDTDPSNDLTIGSTAGGALTGTFPNPQIAAAAIGTSHLANSAVNGSKLAANAVNSSKIVDGTVSAADLAPGLIPSTLPPNGPAAGSLSGTYPNPTIAPGAIGADEIADDVVTTDKIMDATITAADIAPGVIPTSLPIAGNAGGDLTGAFPNPQIAANAVGSPEIAANAVTNAKLASGAVNSAKIADGTVAAVDLAPGVIPTTLPPSGPASGDLTGTYPNPEIGLGAVGTDEIEDGAINSDKIADGSITAADLEPGLLGGGGASGPAGGDLTGNYPNPQIAPNTIGSDEIADASIGGADLSQMGASNGQILKWNGAVWTPANESGGGGGIQTLIQDSDMNTKVETEATPNENVIRFMVSGNERMVLKTNAAFSPVLELPNTGHNTIIGTAAGANMVGGSENTFVGYNTGNASLAEGNNTYVGAYSGQNSIAGNNTFLGAYAGAENISGNRNTFAGANSGGTNLESSNNAFFGTDAGSASTGGNNTFIGESAGATNTSGTANVAVGKSALGNAAECLEITAVGAFALQNNGLGGMPGDGNGNTAVGFSALKSNTTGSYNTAFGHSALVDNTEGDFNIAIGNLAMMGNVSGERNLAIGNSALWGTDSGHDNVAIGDEAMRFADGSAMQNVALGNHALWTTDGIRNTALGSYAMPSNTSGDENVAIGYHSMLANQSADWNVAVGVNSLLTNWTGNGNTAIGHSALQENTVGFNNTALGYAAGVNIPNNVDNVTCLGFNSGFASTSSNDVNIGNSSVDNIAGQVNFTTYSDQRIKRNVLENVPGLNFISKLRPVTYNLDIRRQHELMNPGKPDTTFWPSKYDIEQLRMTGFLAQEVASAAAETGFDFSGIVPPGENGGIYGLRYSEFTVPLVKAVQELEATVLQQKTVIDAQQAEISRLKNLEARLARLEAVLPVAEH